MVRDTKLNAAAVVTMRVVILDTVDIGAWVSWLLHRLSPVNVTPYTLNSVCILLEHNHRV